MPRKNTPPKKYIIGIDIGYKNLGMCVWDIEECKKKGLVSYIPYLEPSTLLCTANGDMYKDYSEALTYELVYKWIRDRWEDYFSNARLVLIEKQLVAKNNSHFNLNKKFRACLNVELVMYTILKTYTGLGGPEVITKGPVWWKNKAEVNYGGHHHNLTISQSHDVNKISSIKKFKELFGNHTLFILSTKFQTNKLDDVTDAYFMTRAAYESLTELIDEAKKNRNNSFNHFTQKKRFDKREREEKIEDLRKAKRKKTDNYLPIEVRKKIYQQHRF